MRDEPLESLLDLTTTMPLRKPCRRRISGNLVSVMTAQNALQVKAADLRSNPGTPASNLCRTLWPTRSMRSDRDALCVSVGVAIAPGDRKTRRGAALNADLKNEKTRPDGKELRTRRKPLATLLTIPRRLPSSRVAIQPEHEDQKDPIDDHRRRLSKPISRLGDERDEGRDRHGDRMFPR